VTRALDVLLNEQHLRPSQIILGGSSAGGNLVLALLAHLHDPAPGVPWMFLDFWKPREEIWADIFRAGEDFWATLPVKRMAVTVGEFEVFRDDVVTMAA
jgi:hypothetical protein